MEKGERGGDGKRSNRCGVGVGREEEGRGWQAVKPLLGGRMEAGQSVAGEGGNWKGRGRGEEGEGRKCTRAQVCPCIRAHACAYVAFIDVLLNHC